MRALIYFLILLFHNSCLQAQRHDQNWVLGYTLVEPTPGSNDGVLFNFSGDTLKVDTFLKPIRVGATAFIMSDSLGNFQFYSNGKSFYDTNSEIIENGDTINYSEFFWDTYRVYPISQAMLGFPKPEQSNIYGVFHLLIRNLPDIGGVIDEIRYSEVDMNANGSKGRVVVKDSILLTDTLCYGQLTGVKHGNGRDWWIIQPEYSSNKYYKWLLTPLGLEGPFEQKIGKAWSRHDGAGQAKFNNDGTKYIRYNTFNDLHVFDFDRCTGLLNNPIHINMEQPVGGGGGVAVSPNNKYLYVSSPLQLNQFDLEAPDLAASKILVDTFRYAGETFPHYFYLAETAFDGKIYIVTSNGDRFLHVIHSPDLQGKDCNFEQRGVKLPVYNGRSLPHFVNFRLGAKKDSQCDTLRVIPPPPPECDGVVEVYPNPTPDLLTIKRCPDVGNQLIQVFDVLGKLHLQEELPVQTDLYEMSLSNLSNGMYFYSIKENRKTVKEGKVLKID